MYLHGWPYLIHLITASTHRIRDGGARLDWGLLQLSTMIIFAVFSLLLERKSSPCYNAVEIEFKQAQFRNLEVIQVALDQFYIPKQIHNARGHCLYFYLI